MKEVYKSKVDLWLICFIMAVVIIPLLPVLLFAFSWTAAIISLGLLAFIFYCLFSTQYIISDDILNIKCGFLINDKINIMDITKISPSKSIVSAPAASLDRIGIYLNKQRTPVIISPKHKSDFINKLKSINPNINTHLIDSTL